MVRDGIGLRPRQIRRAVVVVMLGLGQQLEDGYM